jgi:8-oxo-dGTP pyrophosphatase MutT (NUDIX family)
MSLKVEFTVAAVAERDGRFLLVQERAARRVVLNQPAGHLEDGESLIEAVIRETREETAREFVPQSLIGLYLWRGPGARTILRIAFAGSVGERDESAPLDRAILRTLWLGRPEVMARAAEHRSPLVLRCIDDYIAGTRHPLSMLQQLPTEELPRLAAAIR